MSINTKKKKKQVLKEPEQEEVKLSAEIDQVLKEGRKYIEHAIHVSDEQLTKTKKAKVREMAEDLDKLKHPKSQICHTLCIALKGLVHESNIREALDPKYKDATQSQYASAQNKKNHASKDIPRLRQELKNKEVLDWTSEDFKIASKTQLRKAVSQMKEELTEQQLQQQRQEQEKKLSPGVPEYDEDAAEDNIRAELHKEYQDRNKENVQDMIKLFLEVRALYNDALDTKLSDEEFMQQLRKAAKAAISILDRNVKTLRNYLKDDY